jgi:small conductance mechanosensitive channel
VLALNLAPLFSFGELIRRLAEILRIDGEELTRAGARVLGIWLLAYVAYRVVVLAARRIEVAVDDGDDSVTTLRERRGQTIAQLLRSVGRVVVVTIAVLLTFNVFIDIGPILAGAGILGLAVSFGAQSLVKDVISGFFILFENQFAIGDVIEVAGKSGLVEKMTLRVVQLRDAEGIMHVVPNGEIKVVSNKTRGWSRAVVDVGVPYDENVDRAIDVLRDEAAQFSTDKTWGSQLDGPVEVLGVESLGDSAVVLRTVIRTQPGSQWNVAREFRRRIKNRFDREELEIPFPQRRVHVRVEGGPGPDPIAHAAAAGSGGGASASPAPSPAASTGSSRSSRGGSRCTPAAPPSTTTRTSGTSGPSCSRTCCAAGSRRAATRSFTS